MSDKEKFFGSSFAVKNDETVTMLQEILDVTRRNMVNTITQDIYSNNALSKHLLKSYVKPSWFTKNVVCRFKEIKNRISNAYDCLVKGVDPYDY